MGNLAQRQYKKRARRQVTASIAIFALIAQILIPFGQALAFSAESNIEYQVVCTANGFKKIAIDTSGDPIEAPDGTNCPLCLLQGSSAVLQKVEEGGSHVGDVRKTAFAPSRIDNHTSLWRAGPRAPRGPPLGA